MVENRYARIPDPGYEARVLGALGDAEGTRAALNRMRASATDLPLQPGISPPGPAAAEMMYAGVPKTECLLRGGFPPRRPG
ncbi:hypothetical protein [Parafrankia sp. FMc2]|uniref:hypothetical protein n=1 Tax=Parafrankia sp. FMc2 TaxID=3233196 RepID=UPI0034D61B76